MEILIYYVESNTGMQRNGADGSAGVSRRAALASGAGVLSAGLAGCFGGRADSGSGANPTVAVSFFSFFDFTRRIAAETRIEAINLVPTGLHGHGWEPDASVTRNIIEADAFVHVGRDFQPWADRAIETVRDDGADTKLINSRENVELLGLASSLDRDEEGVGQNRGKDPHFWLDPQRAKQSVDTITEGLVDLAPDHEDRLRENADGLKSDVLDRIDSDYQAIFGASDRDVVQLAAHNAFQYIGSRYGVEMRPLVTNLAASGDVKPSDVVDAKRVIDDNDIRYIGAGVFETRRPAEQLVAETAVEAYFPVTPFAGVLEEWVENGWGYEEVADNINMPTFEVVLGNKSPSAAGPDGWGEKWGNFE